MCATMVSKVLKLEKSMNAEAVYFSRLIPEIGNLVPLKDL